MVERLRADKRVAKVWYVTCEQQVAAVNVAIPGDVASPALFCARSPRSLYYRDQICATTKPSEPHMISGVPPTRLSINMDALQGEFSYLQDTSRLPGVFLSVGENTPPAGSVRYAPCVYLLARSSG